MPDLPDRGNYERRLERGLNRAFVDIRRRLADALWREGTTYGQLANTPDALWLALQQLVEVALGDTLSDVYAAAQAAFAQALTFGVDEAIVADRADRWAGRYAQQAAVQFTQRTRQALQRRAERTPERTLTRSELDQLLRVILSQSRAQTNAVTEVSNAISAGESGLTDTLRQDGAQVDPVWFTQLDERVCPICAPRHGQLRGEGWQIDPPAHPNCRCYLGYRIRRGGTQVILFDDDAVVRRLRRRR